MDLCSPMKTDKSTCMQYHHRNYNKGYESSQAQMLVAYYRGGRGLIYYSRNKTFTYHY